jgi:hypothetical protein
MSALGYTTVADTKAEVARVSPMFDATNNAILTLSTGGGSNWDTDDTTGNTAAAWSAFYSQWLTFASSYSPFWELVNVENDSAGWAQCLQFEQQLATYQQAVNDSGGNLVPIIPNGSTVPPLVAWANLFPALSPTWGQTLTMGLYAGTGIAALWLVGPLLKDIFGLADYAVPRRASR